MQISYEMVCNAHVRQLTMNFLLSVNPIRDTGPNTKRKEIILNWMGLEMFSSMKITGNNDDDDNDEEDKNDDNDKI